MISECQSIVWVNTLVGEGVMPAAPRFLLRFLLYNFRAAPPFTLSGASRDPPARTTTGRLPQAAAVADMLDRGKDQRDRNKKFRTRLARTEMCDDAFGPRDLDCRRRIL